MPSSTSLSILGVAISTAMIAHIAPSLIVRNQEHYIGRGIRRGRHGYIQDSEDGPDTHTHQASKVNVAQPRAWNGWGSYHSIFKEGDKGAKCD